MNQPVIPAADGAPGTFRVRFETSAGEFIIEAHRSWAPHGVDRFHELVDGRFFEGCRFFRVLDGFVAQFGISGDPVTGAAWRGRTIPDDPVVESNLRGRVTFAMAGPESRTTQLFINIADNAGLDAMGFAPIAEVVEGMEGVSELFAAYGEGAPRGGGPDQGRIQREGEAYLAREFPRLDVIRRTAVVPPA
jgi:peptidyl-prolyl cis-trans isomerase A (cyclophilin A)